MNTKRQSKGPVRLVIIDDHPIVRKGLSQLIEETLDLELCGGSETAPGALELIAAVKPDVAIVDLRLGNSSGLDLIKSISVTHPDVHILVLSMRDELLYAERALKAGATGYIMKHESNEDLLTAIRRVARGRPYVSGPLSERLLSTLTRGRTGEAGSWPMDRLTDREQEVFELAGRGMSTKDIAKQLHVSIKTVDSHYDHIKAKLGLSSVREIVRLAVSMIESA